MIRVFGPVYDWVLRAAAHSHARWYLGGVSFAESSFFPVPPDVMLIPMALAKPADSGRLALITTVCSVLGALLGYGIGLWAFDVVGPWLQQAGYGEALARVQDWYRDWGAWAVLVAGFSPIPYKIFTIASGLMALALPPFLIASLLGRGARFFLVAYLVRWAGPAVEPKLRRYVETLGWGVAAAFAILVVAFHY